jgi:hypothetical protein
MKRILSFCIVTSLISCENNDLGLKSNPIDSKILIETREVLEPDSRRLTFYSKTERIYPCVNYPILTKQEVDENLFKITFTSVGETDLCLTAPGPATTLLDFNTLSTGEYSIELNNANLKNKGTLKVTDTDITFLFEQKNGIEFVRENTKRVPINTYWGTIGYHVQSSAALVDEFIKKFADAGAVFNKQSPGHYFYYEIDNSGDIVANAENSGYYFMRKFIFQYNGDESKLRDLVQVEAKNYKDALSVRLETYKGEIIHNWAN